MKPTVGRIVHLNTSEGPHAAIVIDTREMNGKTQCTLSSCNPHGTWGVRYAVTEGTDPGTWSWPPRV